MQSLVVKNWERILIYYPFIRIRAMMRRFAIGVSCVTLFLVSAMILPAMARTELFGSSAVNTISVNITNAEYNDADGDLSSDDIVGWFTILLSGAQKYTLTISVTLELPSGTKYSYSYIIITVLQTLQCTMYFYDHAYESGDYVFGVEAVLRTGGLSYCSEEFVFDPPGGSGNTDPCAVLEVM